MDNLLTGDSPEFEQLPPDSTDEPTEENASGTQVDDTGEDWNLDLPDQLQNALRELAKEAGKQEMFDRRREVLKDRLNRFYERGFQHVYERSMGNGTFFVQGEAGASFRSGNEEIQCPNFIDDYNIFRPFANILTAVHTQNPPGIHFLPKNPNESVDMEAAKNAEGYRKVFDRNNDQKSIQKDVIRMFLLSGRCVTWTYSAKSPQKWGVGSNGQQKQVEATKVYGTLESKVPIMAKSLSDYWYCILTDDQDIRNMKAEYPKFADKIKSGVAGICENTYERVARLGVLNGNRMLANIGDALPHMVVRQNVFFRPSAWVDCKDVFDGDGANEDGSPLLVRDKLSQLFPLGVQVTFIGDVYVGSKAQSMDDCLCVGFPYKEDGQSRSAIMDDMIPVQDRFNDSMNAAAEVWAYGWPSTWINADDIEYDAIVEQKSEPFAIRQKKARNNNPLDAEFYREDNPELPKTFMEYLQEIKGDLPQFLLSAPPAIFGQAMEDQKTASGYAQARNQAMGTQSIVWASIQEMFAAIYYQAALLATKNPDYNEEIVVPFDKGTMGVSIEKLAKGSFGAYPDLDAGFPETTMQKRNTLTGIVTMAATSPYGQSIFQEPDNWEYLNNMMGLPEIIIPQAQSRNKQLFEIEQLLAQAPIPPSPEEMQAAQTAHATAALVAGEQGQPAPPFNPESLLKPSVMPDPLDYHEFEFEKCKQWLSSEACRRELANGNDMGVKNIRLHAAAHQAFMAAQAPPPGAVPPPEAKKPTPPPPPTKVNENPTQAQSPASPNFA